MGILPAGIIGGYFPDFETGLWLSAVRGQDMQIHGDPTPTAMVPVITRSKDVVDKVLENNPLIDLCLINDEGVFILGGPYDSEDLNSPLLKAIGDVKAQRGRVRDIVNTDRAMHGRYVRPAKPYFEGHVKEIADRLRNPIIPAVGTLTGEPITDSEGYIQEMLYGFDNTFDNTKPLGYFRDGIKVHVFSEVNKNGTFARSYFERTKDAIATHQLEAAGIALGTLGALAAAGFEIYEVMTREHPANPKNPNASNN